jgi:endonuclease-3
MPALTNKQQLLDRVFALLKKHLPAPEEADKRPVLEEIIYGMVREGASPTQADKAFGRLKSVFFDWNEIRVSSVQEVEDALRGLPGAGDKARRLVGFLQEHFEENFSFSLDELDKKGLKQAAKQLGRYKDVTDFVVAWVIQRALGGHAVPLDEPALRVLRRLHVVDGEVDDLEGLRGSIEHVVPKARGPQFTDLLAVEATTICVEGTPHCPTCPLKGDCPTGQELLVAARKSGDTGKHPRPKSR